MSRDKDPRPRAVFGGSTSKDIDAPPELVSVFKHAQRLLLTHPLAAQAIFRAFVAEGRRYAQTEEGAQLRDELADSELMRQGRAVFEGVTCNMLEEEEHATSVLPSALFDAMMVASQHDDVDLLIDRFVNPWSGNAQPDDPSSR